MRVWFVASAMTVLPTQAYLGLGIDLGTSGVRACVVDEALKTVSSSSIAWDSPEDAKGWVKALDDVILQLPAQLRSKVERICVSGTSGSCLAVAASCPWGAPTRAPRMYNFNCLAECNNAPEVLNELAALAPPGHTTLGGTSALLKLLCWHRERPLLKSELFLHQADYVAGYLTRAERPTSDWNNALKASTIPISTFSLPAGYDVHDLKWPDWLISSELGAEISKTLPHVIPPGTAAGALAEEMVEKYGVAKGALVVAGTTDSIAAFLASGASTLGTGVTSLGSTMAIKLLSSTPVEDSSRGVYSHRITMVRRPFAGPNESVWLCGGASNCGCVVLRELGFSNEELQDLSQEIDPSNTSPFGSTYYPLPPSASGERFPVDDPNRKSVLNPRPSNRKEFLWSILESLAMVERDGYRVLEELGSSTVTKVLTAGGGSVNQVWGKMRSKLLGVECSRSQKAEAAYGAALLAMRAKAT
ncbi:unnamed protein product [Chrysoparadoxa australica]